MSAPGGIPDMACLKGYHWPGVWHAPKRGSHKKIRVCKKCGYIEEKPSKEAAE